jgi:hypothetical protein
MKTTLPGYDNKTLAELILTAQVLSLARQLKAEDRAKGKEDKIDYERKAIEIIKSARDGIMFRWNYELPAPTESK